MSPRLARLLAALGLLLQSGLWLALVAGALQFLWLYLQVAPQLEDPAVAAKVEQNAALALLLVKAGQVLALSGIGLMVVALWLGRVRARWIFWGGVVALAAWTAFPPWGTLLGVGGILGFVLARGSFCVRATGG